LNLAIGSMMPTYSGSLPGITADKLPENGVTRAPLYGLEIRERDSDTVAIPNHRIPDRSSPILLDTNSVSASNGKFDTNRPSALLY
jgi:hypothetical protein